MSHTRARPRAREGFFIRARARALYVRIEILRCARVEICDKITDNSQHNAVILTHNRALFSDTPCTLGYN